MQEEKELLQKEIDFIEKELSNAFTMFAKTTDNNSFRIFAQILAIASSKIKGNADVVLSRYQGLHKNIKYAQQEELQMLVKFVYKLKDLDIPKGIEHYAEIMKLHLEIIEMFDNAAKTQETQTEE
jgi:hypothetical protein